MEKKITKFDLFQMIFQSFNTLKLKYFLKCLLHVNFYFLASFFKLHLEEKLFSSFHNHPFHLLHEKMKKRGQGKEKICKDLQMQHTLEEDQRT